MTPEGYRVISDPGELQAALEAAVAGWRQAAADVKDFDPKGARTLRACAGTLQEILDENTEEADF